MFQTQDKADRERGLFLSQSRFERTAFGNVFIVLSYPSIVAKFPLESLLAYKVLHNIDKRRVFYFLVYNSSDGKEFKVRCMKSTGYHRGSAASWEASQNSLRNAIKQEKLISDCS